MSRIATVVVGSLLPLGGLARRVVALERFAGMARTVFDETW